MKSLICAGRTIIGVVVLSTRDGVNVFRQIVSHDIEVFRRFVFRFSFRFRRILKNLYKTELVHTDKPLTVTFVTFPNSD